MRHQKGASYIAILFAVIGLAFIAKALVAVWGPYVDDRLINDQIEQQIASGPKNLSPAAFDKEMDKRFQMNMVDKKFADVAKVSNENGLLVEKNYEIRKPFLLNIDIVLKFEKRFDQSSVQAK
ncbi:DUF4845 domain-containing protein [Acinetobacter cumulans]|jgi:hypothetical protein|uniref:DUF4845 domain-containing protein n=1 Tax=Acinetobacter cumulans TaxID=2136182 RepID=A0A3A8G4J4_9GAMM|nr:MULTISPECIES: DUF4845 domain-containing protein [Acinetobacter]NWK75230.1 DUF4845 domain-containing protein [Acinetobacter sp. SwsAc6]QCO22683.1 DUF4845 domain-containing protein [Acinetobacter cumulans]RKG41494.1 DUF4845 domain-containing protein [Acinetobacter cumulans]RKG46501.1 DUF4845 domain-containing protein [Acinetobacter cumulans]RKG53558.1 DUF4845 domain-containing protein [Acinetobacter cumulans]